DPRRDSRVPDIIVQPELGVIYTKSQAKNAEHGGFSEDDTHVALLVADGRDTPRTIKVPVQTAQIAPTILWMLGLDPDALRAVRSEGTGLLPGLEGDDQEDLANQPGGVVTRIGRKRAGSPCQGVELLRSAFRPRVR